MLAQQPVDAASVLLKRAVEVDATVAREGMEFGVLHREVAVGGQMLTLRGLGGEYPRSSCRCTAPTRRTTPRWRSPRSRRSSASARSTPAPWTSTPCARAFAAVTSPGRMEVVRRSPTVVLDAAHNPAGARAAAEAVSEAFGFSQLVGVVGASADKDVRGLLEAFEPIFAEVVVTRNSSHRAMDVDELAALAVEVFGADRVQVEPRLDDALEAAITLAEEEGEYAGAGVLVTGSVITVGEARLLLGKELTDAHAVCEHPDRRVLRHRLRRAGRDEASPTCRRPRSGRCAAIAMALCVLLCGMLTRPGGVAARLGAADRPDRQRLRRPDDVLPRRGLRRPCGGRRSTSAARSTRRRPGAAQAEAAATERPPSTGLSGHAGGPSRPGRARVGAGHPCSLSAPADRCSHPGSRSVSQRTLVLLKPDAVTPRPGRRDHRPYRAARPAGRSARWSCAPWTASTLEQHYAEHVGKPFYEPLVEFMASGPVVALVVEGERVIEGVRALAGPTDPIAAPTRLHPRGLRHDHAGEPDPRLGLRGVRRARDQDLLPRPFLTLHQLRTPRDQGRPTKSSVALWRMRDRSGEPITPTRRHHYRGPAVCSADNGGTPSTTCPSGRARTTMEASAPHSASPPADLQ